MTTISDFNRKECEKIDAQCVDVELNLTYDDLKNEILILENPWGDTSVDMSPVVNAAETHTTLQLSPADNPTYIDYQGESKAHQCISGDDLSRIITLSKLKDVDQDSTWETGYAPVWDATDNTFKPFNVKGSSGGLDTRVTSLESRTNALETTTSTLVSTEATTQADLADMKTTVAALETRVAALEALLTKPDNIPTDATVAWSNANIYTQTDQSTGEYVHDPATAATGDRTVNSDVS